MERGLADQKVIYLVPNDEIAGGAKKSTREK